MNTTKRSNSYCEGFHRQTAKRLKTLRLDPSGFTVSHVNFGTSHVRKEGQDGSTEWYYKCFRGRTAAFCCPNSMDAAKGLAEIHLMRGELKPALTLFNVALRVGQNLLGAHPKVASILNKLGNLYYELRDYDSAMKFYERGLAIEQVVLAPSHPYTIVTMTNIALIHENRREYAAALRVYSEARRMQEETFGLHSIEIAKTLSSMGSMHYHMKRLADAFDCYRQALRLRRCFYGTDEHLDVASSLNSLGLVLFKQMEFELAKKCFTKSLRIRTKLLGPSNRQVAILYFNLASILIESGEEEEAKLCYKRCLEIERMALGLDHPEISRTLQRLGQVFQQTGELESAVDYFREACRIERKNGSIESVARLLNLIGDIQLLQGDVGGMMECYIEASRTDNENQLLHDGTLEDIDYNFYLLSKVNPACAPVA